MRLEGYVYLATDGTGFYKIGSTAHVASRISQLNCGNPRGVYLIHSIPADRRGVCESYLHQKYAAYKFHNEWFELPDEAVESIKRLTGWVKGRLTN